MKVNTEKVVFMNYAVYNPPNSVNYKLANQCIWNMLHSGTINWTQENIIKNDSVTDEHADEKWHFMFSVQ
jgi:hypothetical protein